MIGEIRATLPVGVDARPSLKLTLDHSTSISTPSSGARRRPSSPTPAVDRFAVGDRPERPEALDTHTGDHSQASPGGHQPSESLSRVDRPRGSGCRGRRRRDGGSDRGEVAGEAGDGELGAVAAVAGAVPLVGAHGVPAAGRASGRSLEQLGGDVSRVLQVVSMLDGGDVLVPVGEPRGVGLEHQPQPLVE